MTTVRRGKAMPTDGPTAKFLYTIIKQLDLKSIDWNLVASQLEISNGHAARMRYSRFRQQMEGITSTPRSARPKKNPAKPKSTSSKESMVEEPVSLQPKPVVKQELQMPTRESNPFKTDPYIQSFPNLADIPHFSSQNQIMPETSSPPFVAPYPSTSFASGDMSVFTHAPPIEGPAVAFDRTLGTQHIWTPVKSESETRDNIGDIFIKTEQTQGQDFRLEDNKLGLNGSDVKGENI